MPFFKIISGKMIQASKIVSPDYELTEDMADKTNLPDGWTWVENSIVTEEIDGGFPILNRLQFAFGLKQLGHSFESISGLADDDGKIYIENTQQFHRKHPLITQLATALGVTDAQLDDLWLQMAEIS